MKGEKTLAELAQQFDVHPNQITTWRGQLLEGAAGVFGWDSHVEPAEPAIDVKTLHAKIGELTLVNDFLSGALGKAGLLPSAKRCDCPHALPVTRQARELGISRGSIYYLPRPTSVADLAIMRRIDELHMDFPFAGSPMLRDLLAAKGVKVGRLHVSTLMRGRLGGLPKQGTLKMVVASVIGLLVGCLACPYKAVTTTTIKLMLVCSTAPRVTQNFKA